MTRRIRILTDRRRSEGRRGAPREGAAAVEFAMIAFPFFFMMFSILEIGLIFVTDSMLDNAAMETGRLVRTGQAVESALTADEFKSRLCDRMSLLTADCNARATIDVRPLPQFRGASPPDPLAGGEAFDPSELGYDPGGPGNVMLVRVWYRQPLFTPFLAQALSRLDDGTTVLMATVAFRNEPYNQ